MMFDFQVTLGNVLQILSIVGGWIWIVSNLKSEIKILVNSLIGIKERLTAVEISVTALNKATVELARQEVRLDSHAERLVDLEHRLSELISKHK
jgi:hypothetical protein